MNHSCRRSAAASSRCLIRRRRYHHFSFTVIIVCMMAMRSCCWKGVAAFRTSVRPRSQTESFASITMKNRIGIPQQQHSLKGKSVRNNYHHRRFCSSTATCLQQSSREVSTEATDDFSDYGDDDDTIYALSSGAQQQQATAVAVIRISGSRAAWILEQLTPTAKNKVPPPRKAVVRRLVHPITQQLLDQALVLYFPGPNSFTGEDLVELQVHGSRAVVTGILEALRELGQQGDKQDDSDSVATNNGIRYADAGEFTQRAFAHGKLDAVQVEGLADLLAADTSRQCQQALAQLDGQSSEVYQQWRQQLIAGLAHAEAVIDFGDDEHLDNEEMLDSHDEDYDQAQSKVWGGVVDQMAALRDSMQAQLRNGARGELVRQGVKIAIVGPPNAGKSSLFNWLAHNQDAAIVSDQAGTTRDVLQWPLQLAGGCKCILLDTAGVRTHTDDFIEREGVARALQAAQQADLILALVSHTEPEAGIEILESLLATTSTGDSDVDDDDGSDIANSGVDPSKVLLVWNKYDLKQASESTAVPPSLPSYEISCKTEYGLAEMLQGLESKVLECVNGPGDGGVVENSLQASNAGPVEGALITRERHRIHVQAALEALERFDVASKQGSMAVDLAAEELRLAASELGRVTGAVDVEDVLDKLFSDFCIGK